MKIINWFQIPATNLERAMAFYQGILNATFHRLDQGPAKHAFFVLSPVGEEWPTGGELCRMPRRGPAIDGVRVYLNCPRASTPCSSGCFRPEQDPDGKDLDW